MRGTMEHHRSSDNRTRDRTEQREELLQLAHRRIGHVDEVVILDRKTLRQEIAVNLSQIEMVQ